MHCPKCRMEQEDGNLLCDYCGVVFAKYHAAVDEPSEPGAVHGSNVSEAMARLAAADAAEAAAAHAAAAEATFKLYEPAPVRLRRWCTERLIEVPPVSNPLVLAGRGLLVAFLAVWTWRLATPSIESNAVGESFLHLVNLPFHEAGHVLLAPFGDFIRVAGGSILQLFMPLFCALVLLLKTRDPFGAGAAFWWFGENFLDLTPYIDDAGTGELPLLGGNTGETTPYGFHDWEYLMTETGRLGHEHEFARDVHLIGTTIMVTTLVWMTVTIVRSRRAGQRAELAALAARAAEAAAEHNRAA